MATDQCLWLIDTSTAIILVYMSCCLLCAVSLWLPNRITCAHTALHAPISLPFSVNDKRKVGKGGRKSGSVLANAHIYMYKRISSVVRFSFLNSLNFESHIVPVIWAIDAFHSTDCRVGRTLSGWRRMPMVHAFHGTVERFVSGHPQTRAKQLSLDVIVSYRRNVCLRHYRMVWSWPLTSDLKNLFSNARSCTVTWWIFLPSFTEIRPLSADVSHHAKQVLTDNGRTDHRRPENIMPLPSIVGKGIKRSL